MPIHNSKRVEYSIDSGHINIVTDEGQSVPAYWAHPRIGQRFSGICLLHDWWGSDDVIRLLANFFAQMGYYVIAPDLFQGATASTPVQAMSLVEKSALTRFDAVDAALTVLETHHLTNRSVAAIGVGMGGTLAFEAAIKRDDLEAAVAYGGFPQQLLGQFSKSNTPILALFGDSDPYIKLPVVQALRSEFKNTPLKDKHVVAVIEGAGHELFSDKPDGKFEKISKECINQTLAFLENYIIQPQHQQKPRI